MVHHSMSRSQRAKGSKAKKTAQATLLLVVVLWLLYRTGHSYYKKTEVAKNNKKLPTAVAKINLGRKANAGSETENFIGVHRENSHETTAWNREETTEAGNESEESQRGITNGKVDDSLRLPGEMESDPLDHNEIINDGDSSSEQNEFPKEGATENGDGDSTTSNEASMSESVEGSEHDETGGENNDEAEPVTEESTDTSVSADAQSDAESASSVGEGDAATNARSDAEVLNESVNLLNSSNENNVASEDSQKEVGSQMGKNSRDSTTAEANLDGNSNSVMQEGSGSPGRG